MRKFTLRFFFFLVIFVVLFTIISSNDEICIRVSALDAIGQCGDDVYWEYDSAVGKIVISGKGDMYDYYNDSSAFFNSDLKTIIISDGVTSIGSFAFPYCKNLKTAYLPDSLKSIGRSAFEGCAGLKSVDIPDGVTYIGDYSFAACEKLAKINLGKSLTAINYGAFCSTAIKNIDIPSAVTHIAGMAFYNCKNLNKISIPADVKFIGEGAFLNCQNLTDLKLPMKLSRIEKETFKGCSRLVELIIPYNVTYVDESAFYNCSNLNEVVISNPKCEIDNAQGNYGNMYGITIVAEKESKLYQYAEDNGLSFKVIKHAYNNSVITKATTKKNGNIMKCCKKCGKQTTASVAKIKSITLSKTKYAYNGKEIKPSVLVKDSKGNIIKDTYYTVTYSGKRNAVGTYNVKITFKGRYSGNKTLQFKIVIGKVTGIKSIKSGNTITITWNKVAGAAGYQVFEYNKKKGTYKELGKFSKNSIKNNYSGINATLRIRAYYIDKNGKTHYGSYSANTTVKI